MPAIVEYPQVVRESVEEFHDLFFCEPQLRQDRAREWALCRLKTIGEACRAMLNETLRATLTWVVQQVRDYDKDANHVLARLRLA